MHITALLMAACLGSGTGGPSLATDQKACSARLAYVNHNQLDPPRLRVNAIRGRVADPAGDAIPSACIALYRETETGQFAFVAQVRSADDGRYRIDGVRAGAYRLIVAFEPLCTANIPLDVNTEAGNEGKLLHVILKSDLHCGSHGVVEAESAHCRRAVELAVAPEPAQSMSLASSSTFAPAR